jgi:hypothetical protein
VCEEHLKSILELSSIEYNIIIYGRLAVGYISRLIYAT